MLEKDEDILIYLLELIEKNKANEIDLNEIESKIKNVNIFNFYQFVIDFFIKNQKIKIDLDNNRIIILNKELLKQEIKKLLGKSEGVIGVEDDFATKVSLEFDQVQIDKKESKNQYSNINIIPLIISYPPSLLNKVNSLIQKFSNLKIFSFGEFLRYAFNKAKNEVLICNPFIEIEGILFIWPDLIKLAENGIKLKILTRDLIDRESRNFSRDTKKIMGLTKIYELYNSRDVLDLIEVKDFGTGFRLFTGYPQHYEGIHQKMIIIDEFLCYIGSGEIRNSSLYNNGDFGCVFTDVEYIKFCKEFFNIFWDAPQSYLIQFDDLKQFLKI